MLGSLNILHQSGCTIYPYSSYILLSIISFAVSFSTPCMVKNQFLWQKVYSVLTFFKNWRWTSSLLKSAIKCYQVIKSYQKCYQVLSVFPVDFLLIREKTQTLQLLVDRFPSPSVGSGFFSYEVLLLFPEASKTSCGHWKTLSLHLVEGRMSPYGENNKGHILGAVDAPLYSLLQNCHTSGKRF